MFGIRDEREEGTIYRVTSGNDEAREIRWEGYEMEKARDESG